MNGSPPSMLKPALIGGAVFGLLAGIPLVGALNCLCCSLVMGGGFLASFLYSKECRAVGAEFRPGNGAMVGLVAAPFYAIVGTIVSGVFQMLMGGSIMEQLEQARQMGAEIPPEVEEFFASSGTALLIGAGFLITLVLAAVFSTIGGAIGGAVFKVEPPAAAPPPPPMTGGAAPPPTP